MFSHPLLHGLAPTSLNRLQSDFPFHSAAQIYVANPQHVAAKAKAVKKVHDRSAASDAHLKDLR
jgi:hypothetical protein